MADTKPVVSAVILTWNRVADLRDSLGHLFASSFGGLEVVVCDNGSTDGTAEMLGREFPQAVVLSMGRNIGIEAYNEGFRRARGEYVVILDDDSYPAVEAISRMVAKFEGDPQLGIVAFDVRNSAGCGGEVDNSPEPETAVSSGYLMAFNGAGAGVRRAVFEEVGYYPAEFFLYWNEQDLSLRALNAGWTIRVFPDVVGFHKYSPVNRTSRRAPFYYCRNAFWLVWKNYPLWHALALTVTLGRLVARHSLEQSTTVYLEAMWAAMRGLATVARLRRPVRPDIASSFRAPLELAFTYFR